MPSRRSVLIIGSEAVPFAKTGGLADVLGALPAALARLGWSVTLVLPRYRGVTAGSLVEHFPVSVGGYTREVGFYEAPLEAGARALLIDCPDLFDREGLYGVDNVDYPDNPRRFATAGPRRAGVCRAAGRRTVRRARARLAGGARAGLSPHALRVASRAGRRRRASSRFTTSPIRVCSRRTGCRVSTCRGSCSRSSGSSTGDASASSRAGSTTRISSPPSAGSTRARSRRRSSASASTAFCGGAPRIWSAS